MSITPNMNLVLPTVTVTLGPEWASDLNTALTRVDAHNHTTGNGSLIPTAGLNINADLQFNAYNILNAAGAGLSSLSGTVITANIVTNVNGNLYWNNSAGTAVQITSGGSVVAASDGIARSLSPLAVNSNTVISGASTTSLFEVDTTSSVTFTLPAANAVANGRFYEFKDVTGLAGTNNISVVPAGADTIDVAFLITQNFGSGRVISNGASKWYVSYPQVATGQIQTSAVTIPKLGPTNMAFGSLSGSGTAITSTSPTDMTSLTCSFTSNGRPVQIGIYASSAAGDGFISMETQAGTGVTAIFFLNVDGGTVYRQHFSFDSGGGGATGFTVGCPFPIFQYDALTAGAHTIKMQAAVQTAGRITYGNIRIVVREIL